MSESSNFKQYIHNFFDGLVLYDDYNNGHKYEDLLKAAIDVFLHNESAYTAHDIYRVFFMIYQITSEDKSKPDEEKETLIHEPNTLLDLVEIMKKYEDNTGDLIDKQRDHFIHSVNVFLLGLAIYAQNETYRNIFINYVKSSPYEKYYMINDEYSHEEFLYRWGVASLFHDIGYPFEIIGKQLNKFINDGIQPISPKYSVDVEIDFRDFNQFNRILKIKRSFPNKYKKLYDIPKGVNLYKPTDIMAHKISMDFEKLTFEDLQKRLNEYIKFMKNNNFIDHGFFSSIFVLDSYGYLIQKYAKNSFYFYFPIVDSASAILLHNYYGNTLIKKPFELPPMKPTDNPLAYLLILCDELQEWNRQPYGVKDKQKSHVTELDICIDNEIITVDYIIKHGSMGLDFSSKKEDFLKKVLDIPAICELKVNTRQNRSDDEIEINALRNLLMHDIQAPEVLARNVEKLAGEIHEQYNELVKNQYLDFLKDNPIYLNIIEDSSELDSFLEKYPELKKFKDENYDPVSFLKDNPKYETIKVLVDYNVEIPEYLSKGNECLIEALERKKKFDDRVCFDDLTPQLKMSNIRQARSIPRKLSLIGCELAPLDDEREAVLEFDDDELVDLAVLEHDDWCEERKGSGWIYGPKKDTEELITPYLVPYEDLEEKMQKYDIASVEKIPDYVNSINLKVVQTRIKKLTIEMHNFFEEGNQEEQLKEGKKLAEEDSSFEALPTYIKYSNYKYTNYLVKLLSREGFSLVEIKEDGEAVESFSEDIIESLLRTEHNAWVKVRERLGWSYGEERDDEKMTNPNLVDWEDLNPKIKEKNKRTFVALPKLCDKVGLKIVDNNKK